MIFMTPSKPKRFTSHLYVGHLIRRRLDYSKVKAFLRRNNEFISLSDRPVTNAHRFFNNTIKICKIISLLLNRHGGKLTRYIAFIDEICQQTCFLKRLDYELYIQVLNVPSTDSGK